MSKRDAKLLIGDMLEAIGKVETYTKGLSQDQFQIDTKTKDAVIYNLEIIGEAASRLPTEFKNQCAEVEWNKIIGLRNRIVHAYFGIDLQIVWNVLQRDLPTFKETLLKVSVKSQPPTP